MQEPRDGDFVAYIEALQRESAARLARHQGIAVGTEPGDKASREAFFDPPKPPPLEQAVERLVRQNTDARLVRALATSVAGAAFLLVWLAGGGVLWLLLGGALLAYGVPRLIDTVRRIGIEQFVDAIRETLPDDFVHVLAAHLRKLLAGHCGERIQSSLKPLPVRLRNFDPCRWNLAHLREIVVRRAVRRRGSGHQQASDKKQKRAK